MTQDEKIIQVIEEHKPSEGYNPFKFTVAYLEMGIDADCDFECWTVRDYINWKLNDELPWWVRTLTPTKNNPKL